MPVDLSRVFRRLIHPVMAAALMGWFGFHAVYGERGLIAVDRLQTEIAAAEAARDSARDRRAAVDAEVALLRAASLDLDMLDERARILLNFASAVEIELRDAGGHAVAATAYRSGTFQAALPAPR